MSTTSNMRRSLVLAAAASTMTGAALASNFSSPAAACQFFNSQYGNFTSMPNSTIYNDVNINYWDAAASLGPACIFEPNSAELMGLAVKTLVAYNTPFALKGGGHLAIAGSSKRHRNSTILFHHTNTYVQAFTDVTLVDNINSTGVLLTGNNLAQIELSEDQSLVAVGPGNTWGDVLLYLEDYDLAVVGGRMSIVGVPGLLTGGGMSNFGNEYGWASSNIDSYECVLANGDVAQVNSTGAYSDLFWALRGGGNSFCIVTNFNLRTVAVPALTSGKRSYGSGDEVATKFLDAVYYMANDPNPDVKGALTPVCNGGSSQNATTYSNMMFYNGDNTTAPEFFANFSSPVLDPTDDSFGPMAGMGSAATLMSEGTDAIDPGFREGWWFFTMSAGSREALQIVHDTYFAMAAEYFADVEIWITGLALNIISKEFVLAGIANGGEDPIGLDPERAPYIMIEESLTWYYESDDDTIEAFYTAFNANITAQLEPYDVLTPFVYLNDANGAQDVFGGYPAENVQKLKEIREKYDPNRVYTDLMPGGWKVADYEL